MLHPAPFRQLSHGDLFPLFCLPVKTTHQWAKPPKTLSGHKPKPKVDSCPPARFVRASRGTKGQHGVALPHLGRELALQFER